MSIPVNHKNTLFITLGGTLTGFYKAIQAEDLVRTCILAAAGTAVSFILTLVLKRLFRKWMK